MLATLTRCGSSGLSPSGAIRCLVSRGGPDNCSTGKNPIRSIVSVPDAIPGGRGWTDKAHSSLPIRKVVVKGANSLLNNS